MRTSCMILSSVIVSKTASIIFTASKIDSIKPNQASGTRGRSPNSSKHTIPCHTKPNTSIIRPSRTQRTHTHMAVQYKMQARVHVNR